ncbi:MAG: TerB family tellurite resistance protein [Rhizobiaceae bacterium]
MLDKIKSIFSADDKSEAPLVIDKNLAAAVLMVHVIAADGIITDAEEAKLNSVLREHYSVSEEEAKALAENAKKTQSEAIDLHAFTRILKTEMNESDRLALIEDLWEMVYADGELHEFEDNIVWRVAELIGILRHERMALKQRVLARRG